jgi:hypothetical protein
LQDERMKPETTDEAQLKQRGELKTWEYNMFYCVAWLVFSTGCSSLQKDWRVNRAKTFPELQTPPNQVNNAIKLMARFHGQMI